MRSQSTVSHIAAIALLLTTHATASLAADDVKARQVFGVPEPHTLLLLIRSTITALNHANQTGNYTVLRDLGAPAFAARLSAARLAETFAPLRNSGVDLGPVLLLTPTLDGTPTVTEDGRLSFSGRLPTQPKVVAFRLEFMAADGLWKVSAISIDLLPAEPAKN